MKNLLTIARDMHGVCLQEFGTDDLTGYCAVASFALKRKLELYGVQSTVQCGVFRARGIRPRKRPFRWMQSNHSWLEVGGKIVDITVSQFRGIEEDVLIVPVKDNRYKALESFAKESDMKDWWLAPLPKWTKRLVKA